MPAKNPRLSVVLPPSLAATVAAIAEETGESASSLVRGLLVQTEPALRRMLQLVRAANGAKGEIGSGVAKSLDRVVDTLQDAILLADVRAEQAINDLVSTAESVKGRRTAAVGGASRTSSTAAKASAPRAVTRGVGGYKSGRTAGKKRPAKG